MDEIRVDLRDVEAALPVVREVARHTPTWEVESEGHSVHLKLENLQRLGAFKIRGTWNRLSRMPEEGRSRGVSTISSGNHGLSLAWAARRLGIPCEVRTSPGAAQRKVEAMRALGADVSPMPREELVRTHAAELWRSWPKPFIHPFAHPHTIAGQGTVGLELVDGLPDVKTLLVPVGGGGLVSGIAIAVKGRISRAKVFGVQAEGAAPLPTVLKTGRPHRVEEAHTIAEGISNGMVLESMAPILHRHLDGALVVSDDEILEAMRTLALDAKVVAEPAGAAAFAAWQRYREELETPVAVIVSGGNVDSKLLVLALSIR